MGDAEEIRGHRGGYRGRAGRVSVEDGSEAPSRPAGPGANDAEVCQFHRPTTAHVPQALSAAIWFLVSGCWCLNGAHLGPDGAGWLLGRIGDHRGVGAILG